MNSYIKASNAPMKNIGLIKLYNNDDFSQMKKAGKLVAEYLNYIEPFIIYGVTT